MFDSILTSINNIKMDLSEEKKDYEKLDPDIIIIKQIK